MEFGAIVAGDIKNTPAWYWKAKAAKQGPLANNTPHNPPEGKDYTRLLGVEWSANTAHDAITGSVVGHYSVGKFSIFKYVDQTSPMLMQALITNEVIQESEFVQWGVAQALGKVQSAAGAQHLEKLYIVTCKEGTVTDIRNGSTADGRLVEEVSFHFTEWTWNADFAKKQAFWKRTARS